MSARRQRPSQDRFEVASLVSAWEPLALLKAPGFSWSDTAYTAPHRGSPDEEGLKLHFDVLLPLVKLAPGGFPAHALLVEAFTKLPRL